MERNVVVSENAVAQGRTSGLYGDTELRLKRMARRSAPVTSEYGNRRFNDWFMEVQGGLVVSVTRVDLQSA